MILSLYLASFPPTVASPQGGSRYLVFHPQAHFLTHRVSLGIRLQICEQKIVAHHLLIQIGVCSQGVFLAVIKLH